MHTHPRRDRLRANPSLVNCCTIDWFQAWPADALEAVALKQLKEMDLDSVTRKKLVAMCQSMHMQVRDSKSQCESRAHKLLRASGY